MELYKLKPNDYDFIIKNNIMYCCKYLVNIPVLSIINGDLYLHIDMSVINSVRKVLKVLNNHKVSYFLYTPNLNFNSDITSAETSEEIIEFLTDSILDSDNIFYLNFIEKKVIKINDTLIPYLIKYNHLDILHDYLKEIIETYDIIIKEPYNRSNYKLKRKFTFDGSEDRIEFLKIMSRNLIIEDILNF